eukprot:1009635-Alexandrium_andersonii.AAC.1
MVMSSSCSHRWEDCPRWWARSWCQPPPCHESCPWRCCPDFQLSWGLHCDCARRSFAGGASFGGLGRFLGW